MKKKTILIIVGVIGSIVFFASGFLAGGELFDFQDKLINGDKVNNVDDENKIDDGNSIDTSNKTVQLALGRYLYFLAHDVHFNCSSSYFELEFVNQSKVILKNYDELIDNFTDNYIKNEKYLPPILDVSSSCSIKEGNYVDISNCYCGSGSPVGTSSYLSKFEVNSANENEVSYSLEIKLYDNNTNKLTETFNDSFKIKKVNNEWKIDEYTYRIITDGR